MDFVTVFGLLSFSEYFLGVVKSPGIFSFMVDIYKPANWYSVFLISVTGPMK